MKDLIDKKLFKLLGIILGAVFIIIIFLLVFHALFKPKQDAFKKIENDLLKAAKNYYNDNTNLLPQNDNEQISIDDVTLTSLEYLKNMSDLTKKMDGVTCSGKVIITNNNSKYRYTPLLDCGDKYKTQTLISYIKTNETKVYSGDGLYELNNELVYRGEKPNNYVKFSNHLYRIVKISDESTLIILDEKFVKGPWDDRYNKERDRTDGINDYRVSRVKDTLSDYFYNDTKWVKEEEKQLILSHDLYIGKRSEIDNYNDGTIEKSEIIEKQDIGLLPLYDYINASIDANCNSVITNSCANYNYLNKWERNWWTITGDSTTTHKVYRIASEGIIDIIKSANIGNIRPTLYLVNDALYVSGDGTYDNPYIIK